MKRLLLSLVLSISSMSALAVGYNCDNIYELEKEIVTLAAIHDSSSRNPVVQNTVRNELRFHEVLKEDLKEICPADKFSGYIKPVVKTTLVIEQWYELID